MNSSLLDNDLPAPWAVNGSPVGYSSGAREKAWKEQIKSVVPAAPRTHGGTGLFVSFDVLPRTTRAPGFDLDNLLDPVLSAVINIQGWFGGRRPNLRWVAAQKHTATKPGVFLAVREQAPRLWESEVTSALDRVYRGELPVGGPVEQYAAWVERHRMRRLVRVMGLELSGQLLNG